MFRSSIFLRCDNHSKKNRGVGNFNKIWQPCKCVVAAVGRVGRRFLTQLLFWEPLSLSRPPSHHLPASNHKTVIKSPDAVLLFIINFDVVSRLAALIWCTFLKKSVGLTVDSKYSPWEPNCWPYLRIIIIIVILKIEYINILMLCEKLFVCFDNFQCSCNFTMH